MGRKKVGLLAMAYGTPYKEEDIERYYTHIRHGREPSPEALQDLTDRYQAIGGISPLARITEEQTKAIEERLNAMQDTYEFVSYIGLRHIEPFIEDTVQKMAADGIEEAVSIVLAPHFSRFSIGTYNDRAVEAAEKTGKLHIRPVESWYKEEGFLEYWANEITNVYNEMPADERNEAMLIVSAHSLPKKLLVDDPYVSQLEDTAKLISEKTGITTYEVGWQSEGNTPDPWIGPDVQDLTRELHEKQGYKAFVYAPVGFVADHLETLYDNDVECKVVCDEVGAAYYRPKMPNSDPLFIDTLAKVSYRTFTSDAK